MGNPSPTFAQKDVPIRSIKLSPNGNCVKMTLEGVDEEGRSKGVEAVCFNDAESMYNGLKEKKSVSILYQSGFNEYAGQKSVQITIKDWY